MPQRYVLAFMGFLAMANAYIQRFCLSLAITEMVLPHSHVAATGTKVLDPYACPGTLNATAEDDYVSVSMREVLLGVGLSVDVQCDLSVVAEQSCLEFVR